MDHYQSQFSSPAPSSSASSLSSEDIPPLIDQNEDSNRPIQPIPLYPPTLPPPPLQMPERNACYEESHPHYVGLLYRLNFLDLLTRATERELQAQIMFNQQNISESALIINQLLVENLFVRTVLAERERELNELKLALGVKIENTINTTATTTNTTETPNTDHLKNSLLPGNGNTNNETNKVTKTYGVGPGRKNGVSSIPPSTQNEQTNTKHNLNNNINNNHNDTTSSSASSSSSSTSGTRVPATFLVHTSVHKNYPPYIYGSELQQSQPNQNTMMIPTNIQASTRASSSKTTAATTTAEIKKTVTNPSTVNESTPTKIVENSQEKLATLPTKIVENSQEKLATLPTTTTKTLIKKVLIARKNSHPMAQTHLLVKVPTTSATTTTTTTGVKEPQKEFKPQIVSTVSLQNITNANVDESSSNSNKGSSNSGLGNKRKAHITVRDACRIDDDATLPPLKVQRRTPCKSKETTVHSS